jgi:hypothetical protein
MLLLVLLMTQAASTVCGAQCVQHQVLNPSVHTMSHCRSMLQPEHGTVVLQTCPAGTHAFCAIDLLANSQGETATLLVLQVDCRSDSLLPGQSIPRFISSTRLLRSTTDSSPLITALRV